MRRNYFQAGSIWNSPLPNDGSDPSSSIDNHIAGTVRLSNATMETYTQATSNNISNPVGVGLNCFSCHNRGVNNITGAYEGPPAPSSYLLSHAFSGTIIP